ncbi:acyltransferase family protein [Ralstonia pickettii]|uniref:Acyltransferase n=1 Tax=Ralstonia pickettii TaxID=329 RepID=A0AAW4Q3U2_RALPI|nr:acyltransferase family protein [Ralstonia pickettii]MBA9844287.1 acyltransferase [Ralstonia pickettii]MBA9850088.1 acyltransferase [Ralstonia pickettii]MBA9917710.1 acyltransferase [Ralstonia pickettii]MBA9956979.1 acyltransferase [Ralstonia pickettii]MBA9981167.1 acyltransferase [Ralstonia pickettii]
MNYRADIDGLRAVAVVSLLLFHAGFERITGGFVGVDVFFVISGYLITKILTDACAQERFSYWRFLEKRFFRLYPALLATLALTLIGGFLLLSPEHFKLLGEYALSAQFSASNILFLHKAGYFSEGSGTNPLLHTWSLAVEQQFYLAWPILIYLAHRLRGAAVPVAVGVAGVASLLWSRHLINTAPDSAYFLVQSRVFEFAIGALVLWIPRVHKRFRAAEELLLLVGLAAILYAVLMFDKHTPFPGKMALIPCIGAALCLYAGQARFAGLLLRNPLATWIGAISYSVYLIHWPVFVLYRYYRFGPISDHEMMAMAMAMVPFLLAYPMYRFVESPMRRLSFRQMARSGAVVTAALSAVVVGASTFAYAANGLPWRVANDNAEALNDAKGFYESKFGGIGFPWESVLGDKSQEKVSVLLIGDSFAGHLTSGLDKVLRERHLKGISVWESGCLISPDYVTSRNGVADAACLKSGARALELLRTLDVPVIYAQSWGGGYQWMTMRKGGTSPIKFASNQEYHDFMARNVETLAGIAGHGRPFAVMGSPPGDGSRQGVDMKTCLQRPRYIPSDCQNYLMFKQDLGYTYAENTGIKAALRGVRGITFIDPYELFCKNGECHALLENKIPYADGFHLSIDGSKLVAEHFANQLLGGQSGIVALAPSSGFTERKQ